MRRLACVLALSLCCSCTWFKHQQEVLVTSDPLGARIFLDGHDTGETTPHTFDIAGNFGSDHDIELRRTGYRTERRHLYQYTVGYTSRWYDGTTAPQLPPLFIFWTAGDFVFPFAVGGQIVPGELHVKMYRVDEPLLGFDVLRARAAAESADAAGGQR